MNHPRTSVPTLVTVFVAVLTMGLLVAPARTVQSGRRPTARTSRTTLRFDAADTHFHDSEQRDAVRVAAGAAVVTPTSAVAGPRVRRPSGSASAFVVTMAPTLTVGDDRTGTPIPSEAVQPPVRCAVSVSGRAPPLV